MKLTLSINQFAIAILLPMVSFGLYRQSYGQEVSNNQLIPTAKGNASIFDCQCGTKQVKTIVSADPLLMEDKVIRRVYFNHVEQVFSDTSFALQLYDYLYLNKDTIFIIGCMNNPLDPDFFKKSQVLCLLKDEQRKYDLPNEVNFFRPLIYNKRYSLKGTRKYAYSFEFDSKSTAADAPHFTRIVFLESGEIVYYEFNSGYDNYVWKCKIH